MRVSVCGVRQDSVQHGRGELWGRERVASWSPRLNMTRVLQLILSPHYGVVHEMSSESCAASSSGAEKADPSPPRGVRSLTVHTEDSVIRLSKSPSRPRPETYFSGDRLCEERTINSAWLRTTTETKSPCQYTRRTGIRHALEIRIFRARVGHPTLLQANGHECRNPFGLPVGYRALDSVPPAGIVRDAVNKRC